MSGKTVMMRMGAIEERRELNPRKHLPHDTIQEYTRRLQNGEQPPPLTVHQGKGVLNRGALRFHAYKAFYGESWADAEISVILDDKVPDPDEQPELFRLYAAEDNRTHGLPLTRMEIKRVAVDLLRTRGLDFVIEHAKHLNETPESIRILCDVFAKPAAAQAQAIAEFTSKNSADDITPVAGRFLPESRPTSYLRRSFALIRAACRRVLELARQYRGDLTDAERAELAGLYAELGRMLDEQSAA